MAYVFVTFASNNGPTIKIDVFRLITIGAYIKNAQVQAEYALLDPASTPFYTWSSRGPTTDGYAGVDVFAPGPARACPDRTSVPVL
ncbi:hypothetical protein BC937DRAFT_93031 [Endogone sp. FLAS-F59071]|nr:hypothetical protein BC937DRAFT_93031 [Endogone sp. FLAS-F59071]|eukprot:RUS15012.1 hypothetical protein BC937DRAFT_93031 [Endogone sp. FLAS-F59071]